VSQNPAPWDLVVVGGVNTDYTVRTSTLPRPDHPASDGIYVQACGGKGLNQAVAAARLGARVALVARAGADSRGEEIARCLATEGISSDFVSRDPEHSTGAAIIQVDAAGRKQTGAALGANGHLTTQHIEAAASAIEHARVLLVQLEIPLACVEYAVQIAHDHGVTVVLDPAPATNLPDRMLRHIDFIKPNAGEARTLTGVDVRDLTSALAAARRLRNRGARTAIIGIDTGTLLTSEDSEHWYPNLAVHTIDTTGAGDAFAGALVAALIERQPLGAAVAFAHAAAAVATTRLGGLPSLPDRDSIAKLVNRSAGAGVAAPFDRTTYA
jgi:ribokinase